VIDGAFAATRAAHFAATLLLQGWLVAQFFLTERTLAAEVKHDRFVRCFSNATAAAAWSVAVASAAAWLLLLAAELADSSVYQALSDGTAWTLLTQTQFGWVWIGRLAAFMLLAVILSIANRSRIARLSAIALAVALAGALAWSGHAAATPGAAGALHLGADILHLIASGIWLGGLLPFAILLAAYPDVAAEITRRFSSLATLSVLILLPTGIINGWLILPNIEALTGTLYGQLLLAKIALFLLMLAFAGVNRFVLTPQLSIANLSDRARQRLIIHSRCEIALGLAILAIVGVLGTLTPQQEHQHHAAAASINTVTRIGLLD
jgi:copper resistance protein D